MSDAPGPGPADTSPVPDPASSAVVCATCGAVPTGPDVATARLTWTRGSENDREVWTCPACSRTHLRSIEGKLDSAWW